MVPRKSALKNSSRLAQDQQLLSALERSRAQCKRLACPSCGAVECACTRMFLSSLMTGATPSLHDRHVERAAQSFVSHPVVVADSHPAGPQGGADSVGLQACLIFFV